MKPWWCASLNCAIFCGGIFAAVPPPPGHPVIGTWNLYAANTDCVETWEFRADGTTPNFSGSEESFSEYRVSATLTKGGYYILTDRITKHQRATRPQR